ncbi:hypothetical protein GGI42DRAFT_174552 [Trichoderma sp. SZMC 28013]
MRLFTYLYLLPLFTAGGHHLPSHYQIPKSFSHIDILFQHRLGVSLVSRKKKNLFVILSTPTLEELTCNYHLYLSFLYIVSFVVG